MAKQERASAAGNGRTGSSSLAGPEGELVAARLPTAGAVDFSALRAVVSIGQVLELVGWEPSHRSGPQARGPCPIHKSSSARSRSFSVHLEANVFQCFGCGGKGNQLDLWIAVTGLGVYEAAVDLGERLGMEVPVRVDTRIGHDVTLVPDCESRPEPSVKLTEQPLPHAEEKRATDPQTQEQYRRAYIEQLRRPSCPGCGEDFTIF